MKMKVVIAHGLQKLSTETVKSTVGRSVPWHIHEVKLPDSVK